MADATPTVIRAEEAATLLPTLLARAASGETFLIEEAGKPLATLSPPAVPPQRRRVSPRLGDAIWIADDFDDPLPPEIQRYFEGEGD